MPATKPLPHPGPTMTPPPRHVAVVHRAPPWRSGAFVQGLRAHQMLFGRLTELEALVHDSAERLAACLSTGGKLLLCGVGASAAEGQHMTAALCGRLVKDRRPLAALALSADTSVLTGIGHDYGPDDLFARQVKALGRPGDSLVAITCAPEAPSVLRAVDAAREVGMLAIGLMGEGNVALAAACHVALVVPSRDAVRVQEAQQFVVHSLCGLIEVALGLD